MNINRFMNLCTTLAALAAAAVVFAPALRAADKAETAAARKARQEQANLEKYDSNHDGKLDEQEKAAMKADQDKAKAEKKAAAAEKKKQKEADKQNTEN
jgi:high-affinity Fe2+/Pb2+ permease